MRHFVSRGYISILSILPLVCFIIVKKLPKGIFATSLALEKIFNFKHKQKIGNKTIFFHSTNFLSLYRARTLMSKEPDTILWINSFPSNSVFYDIGANVGTYSIYAALIKKVKSIAIEPSFLNLELLFRNVQTNNLQDKIVIIPLSLALNNQVATFYMQNGDNIWGGSHNSSGSSVDQEGNLMKYFLTSSQIEISLDSLIEIFGLPSPDYIKLDVDGLESQILKGAVKSLERVRSILVEVDKKNTEQGEEIYKILEGLHFTKVDQFSISSRTKNQIWMKNLQGR